MKMLRYTASLLFGIFFILIRRLLRGAKRQTWSITAEMAVFSKRKSIRKIQVWGLSWYRQLQEQSSKAFKDNEAVKHRRIELETYALEQFSTKISIPHQLILYCHGGGYVSGSTLIHRPFLNDLCEKTRRVIISVDYRLAPEHPFPAAHDDVYQAYQWALNEGFLPQNITIAGDSAGAALALATLLRLKDEAALMPKAAILISPWIDLNASAEGAMKENEPFDIADKAFLDFCAEQYLQGQNPHHPWVSPILADLSGLPPLLLQVGEAEILFDQVVGLKTRAEKAGVEVVFRKYVDMFHSFSISLPDLPQSKASMRDILLFLK